MTEKKCVLVHLGSGMGNMLMATPMMQIFSMGGFQVDLCLQGETPGAEKLFLNWPYVRRVSAQPDDFSANRYQYYIYGVEVAAPPIRFKNGDDAIVLHPMWDYQEYGLYSEIEMYSNLARCILPDLAPVTQTGCSHSGRVFPEISAKTCVIAPGGQRHLSIRKWTGYGRLAEHFDDVAIVGVPADMDLSNRVIFPPWVKRAFGARINYQGKWWRVAKHFAERHDETMAFPVHAKDYVGRLSLDDTAALIAQAGCVIGNDCGLTHLAIALGKPTFVLVGPSSTRKVFPTFLKNCVVITKHYGCQPCQEKPELGVWRLNMGQSFCPYHIRCMNDISVDEVLSAVASRLPHMVTRRAAT
ncbi:MAG: glycosyltransferase family 9 protein [Gammaproteobacteria bacterium]|nr:glycosyltransferase family 9 protein [Gammaproteobacteria bacterium]